MDMDLSNQGNDPQLDGKFLGTVSSDFVIVAETLKEASYEIRKKGFSDHPIFPICKNPQIIGQLLVDKHDAATQWHYYASFLDEFVQRQLMDKPEEFKKNYKDPDEFCCLFVLDPEFTNFLFIPYPVD